MPAAAVRSPIGVGLVWISPTPVFAARKARHTRLAISPVMPQQSTRSLCATCVTLQIRYANTIRLGDMDEPDLSHRGARLPTSTTTRKSRCPRRPRCGLRERATSGPVERAALIFRDRELKNLGAYRVMNGARFTATPSPAPLTTVRATARHRSGRRRHSHDRDVRAHRSGPSRIHRADVVRPSYPGASTMIWCELRDGSAGHSGAYTYDYGCSTPTTLPKRRTMRSSA